MQSDIRKLDNRSLLGHLNTLVQRDRALSCHMLQCLAEVDRRKLYREHACSSMHVFCVEVLRFSEFKAYKHVQAARTASKYPALLEMVRRGETHLSAIAVIAPHLTPDNHQHLCEQMRNKSKRQVEELRAAVAPKPEIRPSLRKVPSQRPQRQTPAANTVPAANATPAANVAPAASQPTGRRPTPWAPERYKLQLTVSRAVKDKLEQAQGLLRHRLPDGSLEQVLELALDELITQVSKRKYGLADKPRQPSGQRPSATTRHIPNAVKRQVATRDGFRCAYVDATGKRCRETGGLEYHHVLPFAKGGCSTAANLQLRCRAHNALHAEQDYGRQLVANKIAQAQQLRLTPQSPQATNVDLAPGAKSPAPAWLLPRQKAPVAPPLQPSC